MTKEELRKSVEQIVDSILAKSSESETIEKSMPTSLPENGGKDEMKSGTPHTEKQDMMDKKKEVKKSEEEEEKDSNDEVSKSEKDKETKRGRQPQEEGDTEEDHKKSKKEMKKSENQESEEKQDEIKKSEESKKDNGLGDLSEEEVELVKAWRSQNSEEEITKSQSSALEKALKDENETLKKAIENQNEMFKSLSEKIEKISAQPAYDKRGLDRLETVQKSENANSDLTKSQIVDRMLELQQEGKGINSRHIAEFEATGNVSNKAIKKLVMDSFK